MPGTRAEALDKSAVLTDDNTAGDRDYEQKQTLRTEGWQVVSIADNIKARDDGHSYIQLTNGRHAKAVINVYPPGKKDEMHCHPGSEHIFMVFQGQLHIYGVKDGEDVVLKAGDLIHIRASYFYQLCNESDELTVLYQVATKPAKPPRISRYSYRGPNDVDPTTLE
jgi:mannose-6-phosphate isomerase-like protein (cupin superfamily)